MTAPIPEQATAHGAEFPRQTQWERYARLAISSYLQGCLDPDMAKKAWFASFAPYSTHWNIREDVGWTGENPLSVAVQIARWYEGVPGNPPQIMVQARGHEQLPTSLGTWSIGKATGTDHTKTVGYLETARVPIEIAVASTDSDQAENLECFVETALGPLCRLLHGFQLTPADTSKRNYCVTLPLKWNYGGAADAPIGTDQKQRIWTRLINGDVVVEVGMWMQYDQEINAEYLTSHTLTIDAPTEVRVGSYTPLTVNTRRPVDARWKISDHRYALVTASEELFAKRIGTITLSLISDIRPEQDAYASQSVDIVP